MLSSAKSLEAQAVTQATFKTRTESQWLEVSTDDTFKGSRRQNEGKT